eukprot:CAMPEP_0114584534 /NCGR_PEP_ID=MMETSP0125-20121206/8219_1 /TAXON_ID=485358 ORGANISM="Aristerostoma sp., Strain ATCC 50986" /NCGR_SAMPLE_ID=MMETSP0125 /ASSEMBLY_ACC=CAM_ASM_000245 /LENGTH=61 /DNA_ID=CAMNT_0001778991 /DNA_START=81 /DNA_END=266 /DNA_ORIENTATION=+
MDQMTGNKGRPESSTSNKKANESGLSLQVSSSSLTSIDKTQDEINPKSTSSAGTKSMKDVS